MQYDVNFGAVGKPRRPVAGANFRVAVLGDFSGRANAGVVETGKALAARKPIKVDVDNLDTVMQRLKLNLAVPLGEDGSVVRVPIGTVEDFHPDQLVENVSLFEELLQLRRNLQSKAGFERAAREVLAWSGEEALPPPPRQARGVSIATDRKLSDFVRLTGRKPAAEADTDELIRRLVGPFVVAARDSRQDALTARVDEALSAAMRRLLHHPDFQSAEALWRGVEFLVRRIETDAKLQIVLYDISAEELAADLAGAASLDESGLYSLLVEQPAMDAGQGALSLLAGLYQFEATPPHVDLLGRMAQLAGSAGAPFITAIGPDALKPPMQDWHPLTRQAWQELRALPASAYLGLATPRFLLRMPYGRKSDPIDAFAFEEFTRQGGLAGMLWGNPALLAAQLIAETFRRSGKTMKLGAVSTVPDMPVYVYHDADGEQIALPCTERHYSERDAARVASTGVIPVVSLRGRPEVRFGGFGSMAGSPLAGSWAPVDVSAPAAPPAVAAPAAAAPAAAAPGAAAPAPVPQPQPVAAVSEPEPAAPPAAEPAAAPVAEAQSADSADTDLDALLASLNAPAEAPADDATEPDLDALLASLK